MSVGDLATLLFTIIALAGGIASGVFAIRATKANRHNNTDTDTRADHDNQSTDANLQHIDEANQQIDEACQSIAANNQRIDAALEETASLLPRIAAAVEERNRLVAENRRLEYESYYLNDEIDRLVNEKQRLVDELAETKRRLPPSTAASAGKQTDVAATTPHTTHN